MLKKLVFGLLLSVSLLGCEPVVAPTQAQQISDELVTVCEQVESVLDDHETYAVSTDSKQIIITGFDDLEEKYNEIQNAIKGNKDYKSIAVSTDMSQIIIINNN